MIVESSATASCRYLSRNDETRRHTDEMHEAILLVFAFSPAMMTTHLSTLVKKSGINMRLVENFLSYGIRAHVSR